MYLYLCISIYVSLSTYLYLCISIYVSLSMYLYLCTYVSLSMYIYLCISIYLPTYLSIYLSIYLPIYLSIHPSIHFSIYPSNYLSNIIYLDFCYLLSQTGTCETHHCTPRDRGMRCTSVGAIVAIAGPSHFEHSWSTQTQNLDCENLVSLIILFQVEARKPPYDHGLFWESKASKKIAGCFTVYWSSWIVWDLGVFSHLRASQIWIPLDFLIYMILYVCICIYIYTRGSLSLICSHTCISCNPLRQASLIVNSTWFRLMIIYHFLSQKITTESDPIPRGRALSMPDAGRKTWRTWGCRVSSPWYQGWPALYWTYPVLVGGWQGKAPSFLKGLPWSSWFLDISGT